MPWDVSAALSRDEALLSALSDLSPAMAEAESVVVDAIEHNFDTESAAGAPWQDLADGTIVDRLREGFAAGPILQRTGQGRKDATAHREHGADFAEVGLEGEDSYMKFHVSEGARTKIPLRDFLIIGTTDVEKIDQAMVEHIERAG